MYTFGNYLNINTVVDDIVIQEAFFSELFTKKPNNEALTAINNIFVRKMDPQKIIFGSYQVQLFSNE